MLSITTTYLWKDINPITCTLLVMKSHQTTNIKHILVGNIPIDHSDVVGALTDFIHFHVAILGISIFIRNKIVDLQTNFTSILCLILTNVMQYFYIRANFQYLDVLMVNYGILYTIVLEIPEFTIKPVIWSMLHVYHYCAILIITLYQTILQWHPTVLNMIAALLNLSKEINNSYQKTSLMMKWHIDLYLYWGVM